MRVRFCLAFILMIVLTIVFCRQDLRAAEPAGKYRVADLRAETNGADYLVIAPAAFEAALQPLLDYRASEGFRVAFVSSEDVVSEYEMFASGSEQFRNFVSFAYYHWARPAPKYLVIAADAPPQGATSTEPLQIPTGLMNTIYEYSDTPKDKSKNADKNAKRPQELIATDGVYADMDGDGLPDIAVGRLPADNDAELSSMIRKILSYEKNPPSGLWKRRITLFASEGNFGSIDQLLEKMFKAMVRNNINPMYDLNMTYANPSMPYFFVPDRFNEKIIERLNEGSLIANYVGHGLTDVLDDVHWNNKRYPIMRSSDVSKLDMGGRSPFLLIIACLTGNYDAVGRDSISELIMKNEKGPVGVISASVVSQPTCNGIISKEFADAIFMHRTPRIGDAFDTSRRGIFDGKKDEDRKLIDKFANTLYKRPEVIRHNREAVYMYNLLGDPATRIAYVAGNVAVSAPEMSTAGETVSISGKTEGVSDGEAIVSLDCFPTNVIHPIKPIKSLAGDELYKTIEQNYANANNKTAWTGTAKISGGEFKIDIPIPAWLPKMIYYVKVYAVGNGKDAAGSAEMKINAGAEVPAK
ncbi:MAG: C25 family cysteine peptidase [bacterium]